MTTTASQVKPAGNPAADAWRLSPANVWLVAQLELKQRVRSSRWKVSLAVVAALIGGVTLLTLAANSAFSVDSNSGGDVVFSLVVWFVLFLGLVVSPTLSATTINGDVRDGTLAPLQATALSAIDLVLGKLLAAWMASLAFLAVALPFMVIGYFNGDLPALAMVQVIVVLALEMLVVCALGLGWSALTARTAASAVLTYMTVAVLTVVMPIIFGLSLTAFQSERTVTYRNEVWLEPGTVDAANPPDGVYKNSYGEWVRCEEYVSTEQVMRTDYVWWLLAVNPYVIVSDSSVAPGDGDGDYILGGLKQAVREARLGPSAVQDWCSDGTTPEEQARNDERDSLPPVWPWGIGAQALLAAGAVALGVRRVAVPYGTLPTGTRVA